METCIAFTPAALLRFVNIAVAHCLSEDEACAVVRGLHGDHPQGIVSVASVERHTAAVLIGAVQDALAARVASVPALVATAGGA